MNATIAASSSDHSAGKPKSFPPLELVTSPNVGTPQAAYYLNRAQKTLREWASRSGNGPVQPIRVNGRLAWPVDELRRVLGVTTSAH
ncbi:MAG: hypothetical protein Q7V20_05185 [Aquabacterium sp.]|nr:hypothetical protein [Aquabacterium sp.]MDO9002828.1 hypothetical protein [Aquabacterium sp.]